MLYSEFREEVFKRACEASQNSVRVELNEVKKNNGTTVWGLMFSQPDSKCSPIVYLESFYEEFESGDESLDEIVDSVCSTASRYQQESWHDGANDIASALKNYEMASSMLRVKVVNLHQNIDALADVVYVEYLDLAVVAYCDVVFDDSNTGTVTVKKGFVQDWGVSEKTVLERAITNTLNLGVVWQTLEGVLARQKLVDISSNLYADALHFYVVSLGGGTWGAASVFLPGVASKIANIFGEDFYIIPASIHEVLIVPRSKTDIEMLKEAVVDVNSEALLPEEVLSDAIYKYDMDTGDIVIV